jgi:hypothetical protein
MITQNEFIQFAIMDETQVLDFIKKQCRNMGGSYGVEWLMRFRRHMQEALSQYAKTHKYDGIQHNAIKVNEIIAKYCLKWFRKWAHIELLKQKPDLIHKPQRLKQLLSDACERFVRERSY